MKPLHLEMQAFGPFAQREVLDLGCVADRQLVLIHGPTGSGKTTLLDAMCFALYGDTSGAERLGKQMRCAYAAPDRRTYVRFAFRLGARRYVVQREPEQDRPKLRGEGITLHKHVASLWETTESAPEQEGRLIATGAAEVGEAIQSLVGFDASQFRQVVVLPQGRFRQFLVAGADEKEKILETLFHTHDYAMVADALQDRARELEEKIRDLMHRRRELLSAAEVESAEALKAAQTGAEEKLIAVRKFVPQSRDARDAAQRDLERGRGVKVALGELSAAREGLAEVQKREAKVAAERVLLASARAAEPLIELHTANQQRAADARAEVARRDGARKRHEASERVKRQADENFEAQQAREPQRAAATQRVAYLNSLREPVEKLGAAAAALKMAETAEVEHQAALGAARTERTEAQARLEQARSRFEAGKSAAASVPALRLELERLATWIELKERVHSASIALRDKTVEGGLLERAKKQTKAEQRRAKQLDNETTEAWKRGRAGALARSLKKGAPCPVCGSADHPAPATALSQVPSDDEVDRARTQAEQKQRKAYEAREKFETCQVQAKGLEEQVRGLRHDLGEGVNRTAEQLRQLHTGVVGALATAEDAQASLLELEGSLEAATQRAVRAASRVDEASEDYARAKAIAERARTEVERIQAAVPEALRTLGALKAAFGKAEIRRAQLEKQLEDAAIERQARATELSGMNAELAARVEAAARAIEASAAIADGFEERRVKSGFARLDAFLAAASSVPHMGALEQRISTHDRAMQAASDRLTRAREAADKLEPVDLDKLVVHAEKAQLNYESALRAEQSAEFHSKKISSALERLAAIDAEQAELDASYEIVAPIAKVARGTVEPRISFQRFVLASFLDEVLASATVRLSRMSKGRYALHRTERSGHKGRAAGLDLAVTDTYTGTERPVTTLSGGESFLAALALSLGLADVVQQHAGGIFLETLFVDEGFGTLDPESLEYALDTLAALGNTQRLVGIVSHVPELQHRIPTRIEVVPKREGSTTRVTMG